MALTGSGSEVQFTARPENDPEQRRPDLTLAKTRLGYAPAVAKEDGLRRTIDDFRRRLPITA